MNSVIRWDPFRNANALQEHFNRLFESSLTGNGSESAVTTWAPAVDIQETENELTLKADLPGIDEKDIDVRIEKTRSPCAASASSRRRSMKTITCASSALTARSAAPSACRTPSTPRPSTPNTRTAC